MPRRVKPVTLLTICTDALEEIGSVDVPSSFIGSNLPTAKLCVALVNRAGRSLERTHRFNALIMEHTFTTVDGTAAYNLPSDFRAFANMSEWDRTNQKPIRGGISSAKWQHYQSGIVNNTINRWYMIRANQFHIYPTPDVTGDTIAFDYYTKYWVDPVSAADSAFYGLDTDLSLLDEQLLTLDLKWRFLASKGFPAEIEYKEWTYLLAHVMADQKGSAALNLGVSSESQFDNMPEDGFGAVS